MSTEINFFKDEPSRFGQSSSYEPGQGRFLPDDDDLSLSVRAMYSLAKFQYDHYVLRRPQEISTPNAASDSIDPPAIGIPVDKPVLGVPVSTGPPYGGTGLGIERRTRNLLDRNYEGESQEDCKLSLALPQQLIVTDPIRDELDLDLKL